MRSFSALLATALVFGLLFAPTSSAAPLGAVAVERWVVGFDPASGLPEDLDAVLTGLGALDGVALTTVSAIAVTLPPGAIDRLTVRPDVVAARPEARLVFHLAESVPYIGADRETLDAPETVEMARAAREILARAPDLDLYESISAQDLE
jgi:hypothetical protein